MKKTQVLDRVNTERRRLEQNLMLLDPDQMARPGVVGNWSVKDVLAHLAEWERLFLGWYGADTRGKKPNVPARGYSWKTIDALNQRIYEAHRADPVAKVLADFRNVHRRFVKTVEAMSDDELLTPGRFEWIGGKPCAAWINGYAAHDAWGKRHIRAWMRSQDILPRQGKARAASKRS